jgi:hypothetical protein
VSEVRYPRRAMICAKSGSVVAQQTLETAERNCRQFLAVAVAIVRQLTPTLTSEIVGSSLGN